MKSFSIKQEYERLRNQPPTPLVLLTQKLHYVTKIAIYFKPHYGESNRVFLNLNKKGYFFALDFIVKTVERFKVNNTINRLYVFVGSESLELKSEMYHQVLEMHRQTDPKNFESF